MLHKSGRHALLSSRVAAYVTAHTTRPEKGRGPLEIVCELEVRNCGCVWITSCLFELTGRIGELMRLTSAPTGQPCKAE